jgi:hypothetical protein
MTRRLLGLLSLVVLTGCAARVTGFRTIVSPNCLTAPLIMKDCSTSNGSTRCREVEIKYRAGCAQIQAKKSATR